MDVSPFPYQGPLPAGQVQGRDDLLADLIGRVTERRVTALLGPRRYGKTSVLRELADRLPDVTAVWVDLYEVSSIADVAARFDGALAATGGVFQSKARPLAAAASLNLGLVKVELSGPARSRPDPPLALAALLDVLVGTAVSVPTLLIIDEFSSISRVPEASGALRTALQHHYTDLGICFAGSQPSMMRALFTERPQPFYGQADLLEIGPLDAVALELIVRDGFARTGRDAGDLHAHLQQLTGGHPQRAMQLADAAWRATSPRTSVTPEVWLRALEAVRGAVADNMERLYSQFEAGERSVLRAVARSGSVYGAEAELLGLSAGTAAHARGRLLETGDLHRDESGLRVVDPLLADWIRVRFPL